MKFVPDFEVGCWGFIDGRPALGFIGSPGWAAHEAEEVAEDAAVGADPELLSFSDSYDSDDFSDQTETEAELEDVSLAKRQAERELYKVRKLHAWKYTHVR